MKNRMFFKIFCMTAAGILCFSGCAESKVHTEVSDTLFIETDIQQDMDRIKINGTDFYSGENVLWLNGVSLSVEINSAHDQKYWSDMFKELRSSGINCVRLEFSTCPVKLKNNGSFNKVDEGFFESLDAIANAAEDNKVYLIPVLLSEKVFTEGSDIVRWNSMVKSKTFIDTYVNGYVVPFVTRYTDNKYILSVDIIDEPDVIAEKIEPQFAHWGDLTAFFAKNAAAVHSNSEILVTVGMAKVKYNSDNRNGNYVSDFMLRKSGDINAYVDFYSIHYYYCNNSWAGFPFELTPNEYTLDGTKPCIISKAEYLNDKSGRSLDEKYICAYNNGWNGVFADAGDCSDAAVPEEIETAAGVVMKASNKRVFPDDTEPDL